MYKTISQKDICRILFHLVIPEINISTRGYATRENISFQDHSVK